MNQDLAVFLGMLVAMFATTGVLYLAFSFVLNKAFPVQKCNPSPADAKQIPDHLHFDILEEI